MQRRPALDWDDVKLFLALARSRTVGVAATALRVDGSTVSRRLARLEETLAARLFERSRDGIVPTEAADELVPIAEEIEATMARFTTATDGLERDIRGEVRITCPPDVASVVVAPLLHAITARYPALRIVLDASESIVDLTRREADLALRVVKPTSGDLVVKKVFSSVGWILAGSAVHARAPLRVWSAVPWVGWGERRAHVPAARWLTRYAPEVEPLVRTDSLTVQLTVLGTGLGVGLIPAPSVAPFGLVPIPLAPKLRAAAGTWPRDDLYLVTHRALRDVPRIRAVWDMLAERVASM